MMSCSQKAGVKSLIIALLSAIAALSVIVIVPIVVFRPRSNQSSLEASQDSSLSGITGTGGAVAGPDPTPAPSLCSKNSAVALAGAECSLRESGPANTKTEPPTLGSSLLEEDSISQPTMSSSSDNEVSVAPSKKSTPSLRATFVPTTFPASATPSSSSSSSTKKPTVSPTSAFTGAEISYRPGDLTVLQNTLLLSEGLESRIIARDGQLVPLASGRTSEKPCVSFPDFGATFHDPRPNNDGGWIYVINSEVRTTGDGGVAAFTFNSQGQVIDYVILLTGTTANCGGGSAPWGAWISCEEAKGGQNWQVDPTGERQPAVISMGKDGGFFESFTYYNEFRSNAMFFVTEDQIDGPLQRWMPTHPNWDEPWSVLTGDGLTDYLYLRPENGTYIWTTDKAKASANAEQYYPNSEGIDRVGDTLYFISKKFKTMYILNLKDRTYTNHTTRSGVFDGQPDQILTILGDQKDVEDGVDQGDEEEMLLFFTEDGGYRPGIHARDGQGRYYTILEDVEHRGDETTGLAFSPNGKHLYFAVQDAGLIYEITRSDGRRFDGSTVNIKYHSVDV